MDKPRVKPLEWVGNNRSSFAVTHVGECRVTKTANKSNDRYMVTVVDARRKSHTVGYVDGFNAAKAAAQADYEARILAALEPSSNP